MAQGVIRAFLKPHNAGTNAPERQKANLAVVEMIVGPVAGLSRPVERTRARYVVTPDTSWEGEDMTSRRSQC